MKKTKTQSPVETRPVIWITYAYDDPNEAPVQDVSGSLSRARFWMKDRSGFVYRVERLPDGRYGNEQFIEETAVECPHQWVVEAGYGPRGHGAVWCKQCGVPQPPQDGPQEDPR